MAAPTLSLDKTTLADRFRTLAAEWKEATALQSSSSAMAGHPAYQAIIALGMPVVPLLLADLENEPIPWFEALEVITGANPVPRESWGKMRQMADVWVAWGRTRGLI